MIRAVLFDIDGTLTDTNPVFLKALQKAYAEWSGEEKPRSFFHFSLGIPSPETMKILGIAAEEMIAFRDRWQGLIREFMVEARLFPGIPAVLEKLTNMGLPLALVTSKIREEMVYEFDVFGINHFFTVTVCADDVSRPKPAPDSLLLAVRKLSVPQEEVVFVGESVYDIKAAKNANIRFAFASWGALAPQEVIRFVPEYVVEEPWDLVELIETENASGRLEPFQEETGLQVVS